MGTSLGPSYPGQVRIAVRNNDIVTLTKGMVVKIINTANNPALGFFPAETMPADFGSGTRQVSGPSFVLDVVQGILDNSLQPGFAAEIGAVDEDIPVQKVGEIIMFGIAQLKSVGTAQGGAAGTVIASAGSGLVGAADNITNVNPIGLALETVTTVVGGLFFAFVNFLGTRGVNGTVTYTQTTSFMGKAF